METEVIQAEQPPVPEKKVTTFEYYRPKFWKRIFLIIFDALICAALAFGFFNGLRTIINNNSPLKEDIKELDSLRLESGIFVNEVEVGRLTDVVTYYNINTTLSPAAVKQNLKKDIDQFHNFLRVKVDEKTYQEALKGYDEFRLNPKFKYNNLPYYIVNEDGEVVQNAEAKVPAKNIVEDVLKPYIDTDCQGLFVSKVPGVLELQKSLSNMLLFVEIPVSITLAIIVCYLIIPLIFFRGKQTLGRLLFHTGLVNKNVMMVSWKLYLVRFLIFFFLEIVVSVFTAGVPLFISLTMMAFSKKRQTFHDYMLGIEEVDVENSKIFKNKEEVFEGSKSKYDVKKFKMIQE